MDLKVVGSRPITHPSLKINRLSLPNKVKSVLIWYTFYMKGNINSILLSIVIVLAGLVVSLVFINREKQSGVHPVYYPSQNSDEKTIQILLGDSGNKKDIEEFSRGLQQFPKFVGIDKYY